MTIEKQIERGGNVYELTFDNGVLTGVKLLWEADSHVSREIAWVDNAALWRELEQTFAPTFAEALDASREAADDERYHARREG